MSPSKKLFIATTLVATGYAVAALLGAPDPRHWRETLAHVGPAKPQSAGSSSSLNGAIAAPGKVGSVRLLPEPSAAPLARLAEPETHPEEPRQFAETTELAAAPTVIQQATQPNISPRPLLSSRPAPRAKLRNEAPRPLRSTDRPAPTTAAQYRQVDQTNYEQASYSGVRVSDASPPSTKLVPIGNVTPTGYITEQPTTSPPAWPPAAAPTQPLAAAPAPALVSAPPWPVGEPQLERSHVIVDGDSLAKLAGRYLDDPRRSEEIFALNRGVLSDPELLPIGLEIKIPSRNSTSPITATGPLSQNFSHSGLVPIRLPSAAGTTPRAQLLPPAPVE